MFRTDGAYASFGKVVKLLSSKEALASKQTNVYLATVFANRLLRLPVDYKDKVTIPSYLDGKIIFVEEDYGFVDKLCT